MLKSIKTKKFSFWIKSFIFLIAALVLYYVLSSNERLDEIYLGEIKKGWQVSSWLLVVTILLIPVNWSLEAWKWKFLIQRIERINFLSALEGVIAGVTMGFVTPHSIGDYAARIFCLSNPERLKGIGAVFISRISQFYITLYFGTAALVFYIYKVIHENDLDFSLIVSFTVLNNVLFFLIFIFHKQLLRYFETLPFLHKLMPYVEIIKTYSFKELNFVLLLSLIRYLIFCIQFVFMLLYFNIELPIWILFAGVAFIFFVKSIVPTFLDLGVRETAAFIFFGVFFLDQQNVIFASLTLWLLNIVLPTIGGLFLLFRMRLFDKERN